MLTIGDARSSLTPHQLAVQALLIGLVAELPEERRQQLLADAKRIREDADGMTGTSDLAARERLLAATALIEEWLGRGAYFR